MAWWTTSAATEPKESFMSMPSKVQLIDVGPRDGLQNEKQPVPAAVKIELVHRLQAAGLTEIEVTSFVSPKWVPQMADNAEVMAGIVRQAGVRYSVLTPNMVGFQAAVASKPDEIVVFGAASQAFSQKNINCSIEESMERFAPVVQAALAAGIAVRGAMSCTVGCPYEGEVSPASVAHLAGLMKQIGVQRVDVADTIGTGTPLKVQKAIEATRQHFDIDRQGRVLACEHLTRRVTRAEHDGTTTILIITTAFLPLYKQMGMKLSNLAMLIILPCGLGNCLPWGGPLARAAALIRWFHSLPNIRLRVLRSRKAQYWAFITAFFA